MPGKPALPGLPATFAAENEAQTLILDLVDAHLGLQVSLSYTAFENLPVITRSAAISNQGGDPLVIRRALSASVDFSSTYAGYHFVQLSGARWRPL